MNRKILGIPLFVGVLSLATSCNKDQISISRTYFTEKPYTEVKTIYDKMVEKQESSEQITTLYNKGTLKLRRKISFKGSLREDEISFHEIDLAMSSGYDLSWSFEDKYLKIGGENEIIYFKGDDNNKFIRYFKNWQDGKLFRYKHSVDDDVEEFGNFKDYFVDLIEYYTTTSLPFLASLCCGIDSNNDYYDDYVQYHVQPNDLFSKELNDEVTRLSKLYENNSDGYNISCTYGSNDDTTACAHLKGKIAQKDVETDKHFLGYYNIDNFCSFKNNFVSQLEYKVNGKIKSSKDIDTNLDFNIHISEDVKEGECTPDAIEYDLYIEG